MAPVKLKQPPNSAAQTITSSQDARILVRETIRISANLASSPPACSSSSSVTAVDGLGLRSEEVKFGLVQDEFVDSSLRLICCEEIDGRRWKYLAENDGSGQFKNGSIRAVGLQSPQAPIDVSFHSQGSHFG